MCEELSPEELAYAFRRLKEQSGLSNRAVAVACIYYSALELLGDEALSRLVQLAQEAAER